MSCAVKHSDGREQTFDSYMDARRQFMTWQYECKSSKLGAVTLLVGDSIKDEFDASKPDLILPWALVDLSQKARHASIYADSPLCMLFSSGTVRAFCFFLFFCFVLAACPPLGTCICI